MSFTTDEDIHALTTRFIDQTLPEAEWTHAAHFAVALCLLSDKDRDAFSAMPLLIRAYNESIGGVNSDSEGYHETITRVSLLAAKHILSEAEPSDALTDILNTLLQSRYADSRWVLNHWSKQRLFSVEARRSWVEPDLAPLPF